VSVDPNKPSTPDLATEWDDERPTEIRVDPDAGPIDRAPPTDPAFPAADQTDEHPVVLEHELQARTPLPEFVQVKLELISGPHACGPFKLRTVRTVIGRGQTADVRVNDTKMSREHASISYTGSEFRIRDERSTNGTFLNGSRVVEYAIRDTDKLLIGDSLLRFRVEA
jgi:hypothetical protein